MSEASVSTQLDEYRTNIERLCEYNIQESLNKTPEKLYLSQNDDDQPGNLSDLGGGDDYMFDEQAAPMEEGLFSAGKD